MEKFSLLGVEDELISRSLLRFSIKALFSILGEQIERHFGRCFLLDFDEESPLFWQSWWTFLRLLLLKLVDKKRAARKDFLKCKYQTLLLALANFMIRIQSRQLPHIEMLFYNLDVHHKRSVQLSCFCF